MNYEEDNLNYYVRFVFNKWEDYEAPKLSLMSKEERETQEKCFTLMLSLDLTAIDDEEDSDVKIESVEIIYDGFSAFAGYDGYKNRYDVSKNKFDGTIDPVVKFKLSKLIKEDQFMCAVRDSCIAFSTEKMKKNSMSNFYLMDLSGYSTLLDDEEYNDLRSDLIESEVFSGKKFVLSDEQYENCQISINANEFVLK